MTREEILYEIEQLGGHVHEDLDNLVMITKTGRFRNGTNGTAYQEITPNGVYEDCSTNVKSLGEPEIRKYTRALCKLMKEEL